MLVAQQHRSDHFLLTLNLNMVHDTTQTPPHVIFQCNLRSPRPHGYLLWFNFYFLPQMLSSLDTNNNTDTFCSILKSCLYTVSPCPPGTGVFPLAFKQAHITPILQKPTLNTTNLENNRPISLLPFIVKTVEQVVFKQVSAFSYRKISWVASILASKVDIQLFQYLSCWICLPLLTWLTTIFSCQPYWQKASQEPYSSGLSLTSQIGPSRYFGGVRCPNHNI